MITLILATDMARHAEIMDSFKEKMENFDYSNEEHMTLVSSLLPALRGLVRAPYAPAHTRHRGTQTLTSPWSEGSGKRAREARAFRARGPSCCAGGTSC